MDTTRIGVEPDLEKFAAAPTAKVEADYQDVFDTNAQPNRRFSKRTRLQMVAKSIRAASTVSVWPPLAISFLLKNGG